VAPPFARSDVWRRLLAGEGAGRGMSRRSGACPDAAREGGGREDGQQRKGEDNLAHLSSSFEGSRVRSALRCSAGPVVAAPRFVNPDEQRLPGPRLRWISADEENGFDCLWLALRSDWMPTQNSSLYSYSGSGS
jgi:hypothetical protein